MAQPLKKSKRAMSTTLHLKELKDQRISKLKKLKKLCLELPLPVITEHQVLSQNKHFELFEKRAACLHLIFLDRPLLTEVLCQLRTLVLDRYDDPLLITSKWTTRIALKIQKSLSLDFVCSVVKNPEAVSKRLLSLFKREKLEQADRSAIIRVFCRTMSDHVSTQLTELVESNQLPRDIKLNTRSKRLSEVRKQAILRRELQATDKITESAGSLLLMGGGTLCRTLSHYRRLQRTSVSSEKRCFYADCERAVRTLELKDKTLLMQTWWRSQHSANTDNDATTSQRLTVEQPHFVTKYDYKICALYKMDRGGLHIPNFSLLPVLGHWNAAVVSQLGEVSISKKRNASVRLAIENMMFQKSNLFIMFYEVYHNLHLLGPQCSSVTPVSDRVLHDVYDTWSLKFGHARAGCSLKNIRENFAAAIGELYHGGLSLRPQLRSIGSRQLSRKEQLFLPLKKKRFSPMNTQQISKYYCKLASHNAADS